MHSLRFHLPPSRSAKQQLHNVFDDRDGTTSSLPHSLEECDAHRIGATPTDRIVDGAVDTHTETWMNRSHDSSYSATPEFSVSHVSQHHAPAGASASSRAALPHRRGTAGLIDLLTHVWEVLGLCDLHEFVGVRVPRRVMIQFYAQLLHELYDTLPPYPEEQITDDEVGETEAAGTSAECDADDEGALLSCCGSAAADGFASAATSASATHDPLRTGSASATTTTTPCVSLTPALINRALWHVLCHATLFCAQLNEMTQRHDDSKTKKDDDACTSWSKRVIGTRWCRWGGLPTRQSRVGSASASMCASSADTTWVAEQQPQSAEAVAGAEGRRSCSSYGTTSVSAFARATAASTPQIHTVPELIAFYMHAPPLAPALWCTTARMLAKLGYRRELYYTQTPLSSCSHELMLALLWLTRESNLIIVAEYVHIRTEYSFLLHPCTAANAVRASHSHSDSNQATTRIAPTRCAAAAAAEGLLTRHDAADAATHDRLTCAFARASAWPPIGFSEEDVLARRLDQVEHILGMDTEKQHEDDDEEEDRGSLDCHAGTNRGKESSYASGPIRNIRHEDMTPPAQHTRPIDHLHTHRSSGAVLRTRRWMALHRLITLSLNRVQNALMQSAEHRVALGLHSIPDVLLCARGHNYSYQHVFSGLGQVSGLSQRVNRRLRSLHWAGLAVGHAVHQMPSLPAARKQQHEADPVSKLLRQNTYSRQSSPADSYTEEGVTSSATDKSKREGVMQGYQHDCIDKNDSNNNTGSHVSHSCHSEDRAPLSLLAMMSKFKATHTRECLDDLWRGVRRQRQPAHVVPSAPPPMIPGCVVTYAAPALHAYRHDAPNDPRGRSNVSQHDDDAALRSALAISPSALTQASVRVQQNMRRYYSLQASLAAEMTQLTARPSRAHQYDRSGCVPATRSESACSTCRTSEKDSLGDVLVEQGVHPASTDRVVVQRAHAEVGCGLLNFSVKPYTQHSSSAFHAHFPRRKCNDDYTGNEEQENGMVAGPFQLTEVGEPGKHETTSARVEMTRLSELLHAMERQQEHARRAKTNSAARMQDRLDAEELSRRDALVRNVEASVAHLRHSFRLRVAQLPGQQECTDTTTSAH